MAVYRNCNVGLLRQIERDGGDAGIGHCFSILTDDRPIVDFLFATEDDALEAWAGIKQTIARAVEVRAHGSIKA